MGKQLTAWAILNAILDEMWNDGVFDKMPNKNYIALYNRLVSVSQRAAEANSDVVLTMGGEFVLKLRT